MIRPRSGFVYQTSFPTCWVLTVVWLTGNKFGLLHVDGKHARGWPYTAPIFHSTHDHGWQLTIEQLTAWLKKLKAKRIPRHLETVDHLHEQGAERWRRREQRKERQNLGAWRREYL